MNQNFRTQTRIFMGGLTLAMLIISGFIRLSATPGDSHWDRQFGAPGTGPANIALRFIGNSLYTGGYSLYYGQVTTNTVVNVYDGTNWTTIGGISGGLSTTIIYDYAKLGNDLYVAGIFTRAGGVPAVGLAKWDGTNWSGVGGFSGVVFSLATDGTNLYAGGVFTNCGGIFATNIAKWNGNAWSVLGDGLGYYDNSLAQVVNVLVWRDGQLYAGGTFASSGPVAATNLARWNGSSWSGVGGGVTGTGSLLTGSPVTTLQFMGNDLFVGGRFTTVGGNVTASNIAKWNGTSWSALGSGLRAAPNSAPVSAVAVLGTDLYAFGNFTNAGGIAAIGLARWNGVNWSSFGALNGSRSRAITHNGSLYVSGDFNVANYDTPTATMANHVVRWDGNSWHALPGISRQGTHFFVYTIKTGNDGLYAGGLFAAIGSTTARRVARWDGNEWHPLGSGVDTEYNGTTLAVRAIKTQTSDVFIGGSFVNAGGATANNIAKWDGFNWSPLGYGVDGTVLSVETVGSDVYAAGSFITAYDAPGFGYAVNRIARWDPNSGWWPLGSGMPSGSVNIIRQHAGLIYAGGSFTMAGGTTANRIAVWDGNAWSSLGLGTANGLGGTVNTILVDGSDVYVGGSFSTAGGATARGIAKWNGSAWSTLGQGFFHSSTVNVYDLAKNGSYLYACGAFTNAGGVITRNIARWDGVKWESLGSGLGNESGTSISRGYALAVSGNDLYVSGVFETAGLTDAGYIARWNDQMDFSTPASMRLTNPQMLSGNAFKFRASSSERATYVIEHSPNLIDWTPFATNDVFYLDVTNTAPGVPIRSYRMRQVP